MASVALTSVVGNVTSNFNIVPESISRVIVGGGDTIVEYFDNGAQLKQVRVTQSAASVASSASLFSATVNSAVGYFNPNHVVLIEDLNGVAKATLDPLKDKTTLFSIICAETKAQIVTAVNNALAAGVVGSSSFESGTFSRLAAAGNGTETVTTTKQVKLVFIRAKDQAGAGYSSDGRSDGSENGCSTTGISNANLTKCLFVGDNVDNYTATITTLEATSFDVDFIKAGVGQDVDVQWHAITQ